MIRTWLTARRTRHDAAILTLLANHPEGLGGLRICELLNRPAGTLHANLARLERQGKVRSWWADGPYPRRRLYALAETPEVRFSFAIARLLGDLGFRDRLKAICGADELPLIPALRTTTVGNILDRIYRPGPHILAVADQEAPHGVRLIWLDT